MLLIALLFLLNTSYTAGLALKALSSTTEVLKASEEHKDKIWWHYCFPVAGIYTHPRYFPPRYTFIPHQYSLEILAPKKGLGIRIVMIDVKKQPNADVTKNPLSGHAAHAYSLIKRECKSDIVCLYLEKNDKASLLKALDSAAALKPDILLLNLKLDDNINPDTPLSQLLNARLKSFSYVVAAAGNDGNSQIAYPARFEGVTFSVGAFGIKEESESYFPTPYVPSFSQREPQKGPTFLAPGVHVLSKADPSDWYLTMSGTSTAASMVALMLALFLGEYKEVLTKEESIQVLTASCVLPAPTKEWLSASINGILDCRTALFIGLCASKMKKRCKLPFTESVEEIKKYLSATKPCPFTDFLSHARQSAAKGLCATAVLPTSFHIKTLVRKRQYQRS